MFDTNVFGMLQRMENPNELLTFKHEYFMTRVQIDEIENASTRIKNILLGVLRVVPQENISTESAAFDFSNFDEAKFDEGDLFSAVLKSMDARKPEEHDHNIRDALVVVTAIKNNLVLVTNEKLLQKIVPEYGGRAMSFRYFRDTVKG
jgi:hypothetical protein